MPTSNMQASALLLSIFLCYTISFSLLIPAFPKLLLSLTHGETGKSSLIYGIVSSLRYFLEFFSSQYFGVVSDHVGRKPILTLALASVFLEYFLLAVYPSVITIFLSKVISGAFDVTVAISHAILTDIAHSRNESVTQYFGLLAATMGCGFVVGPAIGSIIVTYHTRLCFAISTFFAAIATLLAFYYLPETNPHKLQSFSFSFQWNPFQALKTFYSNSHLRLLSIPYILSNLGHGVYFIWILYMYHRFHCRIIDAGIFLSLSGLFAAVVQGGLIKVIIPYIWTEKQATYYCLLASSLQYFFYGYSMNLYLFYMNMIILAFSSIHGPALHAIIVTQSRYENQGSIQGSISSLRMITSFISSLFYPSLFAFIIHHDTNHKNSTNTYMKLREYLPIGTPFYIAGFFILLSYISLYYYYSVINSEQYTHGYTNINDIENETDVMNQISLKNNTPCIKYDNTCTIYHENNDVIIPTNVTYNSQSSSKKNTHSNTRHKLVTTASTSSNSSSSKSQPPLIMTNKDSTSNTSNSNNTSNSINTTTTSSSEEMSEVSTALLSLELMMEL